MQKHLTRSPRQFYQCTNPLCRLRFPSPVVLKDRDSVCPRCKSPLAQVPTQEEVAAAVAHKQPRSGPTVEVFLDNVRSTFNIGAIFRTSDGAGVQHIHLSGITPLPDNTRISKTALGAEFTVPWSYAPDGYQAAQQLKQKGCLLWALETTPDALSLFDTNPGQEKHPIVMVVGNEVCGIDPQILHLCDRTVCLPMVGYKRSLNVAVAFGIAIYYLRFGNFPRD